MPRSGADLVWEGIEERNCRHSFWFNEADSGEVVIDHVDHLEERYLSVFAGVGKRDNCILETLAIHVLAISWDSG